MTYSFERPRLGAPSHSCPHCCRKQVSFTESDIFESPVVGVPGSQDASTYPLLKQQRTGEARILFAKKRCVACGGVLIFANSVMVYPDIDFPDELYSQLPDVLRKRALRALQSIERDPAATAARLRSVLAEMCEVKQLAQSVNDTYVSMISVKLSTDAMRSQLIFTCMRDEKCVPPNVLYDDIDDEVCAIVLMKVVADAAEALF